MDPIQLKLDHLDFTDGENPFTFSVDNGIDGVNGINGSRTLVGNTDPTRLDPVANTGDFYINLVTDNLFGPRSEDGDWPLITNLGGGLASGSTLPDTGLEGQLFSLTRLSGSNSPSIYRWIGDADNGEWTDDHFIVRQTNLNIPDAYNANSSAFVGRTIWFQNDGSNTAETRPSGLYRWNGGGIDTGDARWELVTRTESVSGITVREDADNVSESGITDINFIGNNITIARRAGDGNIVDITIGGTTPPPPPEFLTMENITAVPTDPVNAGPVTTDVTITPSWTAAPGANVLTANVTGPGITGPRAVTSANGTSFVLPGVRLEDGAHTWTLGIIGTDDEGGTITTPVTVTATITVSTPPRVPDNARAGLSPHTTLEAGDLLEFSTASSPRPGSIEAPTSTEVGLSYIWVLLDRDITSVVISDIQPIPREEPVAITLNNIEYMAYRSTAQVGDDGTSASNFQLNLTQYNQ